MNLVHKLVARYGMGNTMVDLDEDPVDKLHRMFGHVNMVATAQLRSCGTCTACCFHTEVKELGKPEATKCPHLNANKNGCGLYVDRPMSCVKFLCGYRQGWKLHKKRPNKSGFMSSMLHDGNGNPSLFFFESKRGGLKGKEAVEAIAHAKKYDIPIIIKHFGPPVRTECL